VQVLQAAVSSLAVAPASSVDIFSAHALTVERPCRSLATTRMDARQICAALPELRGVHRFGPHFLAMLKSGVEQSNLPSALRLVVWM